MTVVIIYLIVFAASLAAFLVMVRQKEYISGLYFVFTATLVSHNFGRLVLASSESVSAALEGQRIIYFGSIFLPLILLLTAARLCKIRFPRWLEAFLLAYSAVVMGFALTIGRSDIYYKNVQLVRKNGYAILTKEYGPAHSLYTAIVIIYGILFAFLIGYALKVRKNIPKIIVVNIMGVAFVIVLFYFLDRILKLSVALTSFGYLYAAFITLYLVNDIELHDLSSCITSSAQNLEREAFIVFDMRKRYINATEAAKKIFPRLRKITSGKAVKPTDSQFYNDVMGLLNDETNGGSEEKLIQVQEEYYNLRKDVIYKGYGSRQKLGYLVVIEDVTATNSYLKELNNYNHELEAKIDEKKKDISKLQEQLVLGLATIVESRDNTSGEHIGRAQKVAGLFADYLRYNEPERFDDDFLEKVVRAVPMHDLGKIAIEDRVLRKTEKYDPSDFEEIKKHAAEGARVVRKILAESDEKQFCEIAANIANFHHERWDGKGYPDGLKGEEIPVEARIMALVDSLDALCTKKNYGPNHSYDDAIKIIEAHLGTQFDPELGRAFVNAKREFRHIYVKNEDEDGTRTE